MKAHTLLSIPFIPFLAVSLACSGATDDPEGGSGGSPEASGGAPEASAGSRGCVAGGTNVCGAICGHYPAPLDEGDEGCPSCSPHLSDPVARTCPTEGMSCTYYDRDAIANGVMPLGAYCTCADGHWGCAL